jgi:hypothetical protein
VPSLLDCVPEVNPRFTRQTANLSGCDLFRHPNGVNVLTLATGRGNGLRLKMYHVDEVETHLGGRAFRLTPSTLDALANGETDYVVLLNGIDSSCTCAGHSYTGGCKHLSALLHFAGKGEL